uniref:4-hydroxybenzoate polyprenyltransferase, mitochondrial n=1 Tax=Cacopsylla melanoneura TaxID=428564 RepID=A0A8D8V2A4_9HEMI
MFCLVRNAFSIHLASSKSYLYLCKSHQPLLRQNLLKKIVRSPVRCFQYADKTKQNQDAGVSTTSIVPYLKLMRLDKPIGSWLLFWPCGWSISMAAAPGCLPDLHTLALFGLGAIIMRGAGCTINDLWDKDIDSKVSRTKDRPLVNGSISTTDAIIFLAGQLGAGLLILVQLNLYTILLGSTSLLFVTLYPLMKRWTHWAQLCLGMTFNYGALMGYSAVTGCVDWSLCLPLYLSGICWTIVYDTIYAHQDRKEDVALGLKSTAILFGDKTKLYLSGFGGIMMSSLVTCGMLSAQTWPYFLSLSLVGTHLASQIYQLDIGNREDCGKTFVSNKYIGLILMSGIVLGNLMKSEKNKQNTINVESAAAEFIKQKQPS